MELLESKLCGFVVVDSLPNVPPRPFTDAGQAIEHIQHTLSVETMGEGAKV